MNANVNAENKCKTSSIKPQDRGTDLDLPKRAMKEPNLQVGQVGMHVGAISPKCSKESISHDTACITPLPLHWDPGNDRDLPGVAKTGPYCKVRQEDSQERLEVQMAP